MSSKIDFQFDIPLINTLSNVFTFGEFKESYMKILEVFYKKDNNGEERKHPKLSFWDGKSFDKIYNNINNKLKKPDNTLLTKHFINYALRELKSYKGRKSPNKLNLVQEIIRILKNLSSNISKFLSESKKTIEKSSTRDLICYMKFLEPHLKCEAVRKIYDIYCHAYNSRPLEEKEINMATTPILYNLKPVEDYVEELKRKLKAKSQKNSSSHSE